ncbi:MAG TPA: TlyA family RNA methyltransferase [Actinomycetota bacterium]|nr:TlyA family RNA methyltransferase [Actinomycetota bacterium]
MSKRARLDAELVRRGLAASRSEARLAIESGGVTVQGIPASRPATLVAADDAIALKGRAREFVSRGGDKLDFALSRLDVAVAGRKWLDAGASTGGFTDRLLRSGAQLVIALDVGYGQLDWKLRNDERVIVMERTNVRTLGPRDLPWRPEGVVGDLSFISLTRVLPALAGVAVQSADFVLLVKPQFEVGRDAVRGGVVRDPELWRLAVGKVVDAAAELDLGLAGATPAFPPGPAGNKEFFVHLRRGAPDDREAIERAVEEAAQWS